MADTGWNDCSASESNTAWNNPNKMQGSDNTYADTNSGSATVKQYNFNFSIPGGATIDGIEVRTEGYKSGIVAQFKVETMYNGRATAAPAFYTVTLTDSEIWHTIGGATDLWARLSWAVSDFTNANFAVRISTNFITSATGYIDAIQAKVYYTGGDTGWTAGERSGVAPANISEVTGVAKANIDEVDGV